MRSIVAVGAAVLVVASLSGDSARPPEAISIGIPAPFRAVSWSPLNARHLRRARPLGPGAPPWARQLYRRSLRVLIALTDPGSGAMIAGDRQGWNYVWPRDAATGATALEQAGLRTQAFWVASFLAGVQFDKAARFHPNEEPVPGRSPAGDVSGWIWLAEHEVGLAPRTRLPGAWRDRQDYGENVSGDLLGNAIAAGVPAPQISRQFLTTRGLVREQGGDELDSSAAWAVTVFPHPRLRDAARRTLLAMTRESTPYGIPPIEGWTPGEVWTAPTAWSAWALVELGESHAADRLLAELHRAETPAGTLPERVDATDGHPTSTTPLAWAHAFAILALRARYPG
jgi:hypothetical protein